MCVCIVYTLTSVNQLHVIPLQAQLKKSSLFCILWLAFFSLLLLRPHNTTLHNRLHWLPLCCAVYKNAQNFRPYIGVSTNKSPTYVIEMSVRIHAIANCHYFHDLVYRVCVGPASFIV